MIIVSQDRNAILNFDNTTTIKTEEHEEKCEIIARVNNGHFATLGEYATEERAKEILEEIIKCYANTEQYKCLSGMPNCADEEKVNVLNKLAENAVIYEMPQE